MRLASYGDYTWYVPPLEQMPSGFGLVICDGPPGDTLGGRYGMLPVMKTRLARHCVILLDDVQRPAEREVAERWARELGTTYRSVGMEKPFAVLGTRQRLGWGCIYKRKNAIRGA